MVDPWSDAIAEAYASAPLDDVVLFTLELRHPTFGVPIRIVADLGETLHTDPELIFGHRLKLEADATANAGETVEFVACSFEFSLPDQQEGQLPSVSVAIDNVAYLITPQLDALIGVRAELELTYREYLFSDPETPQFVMNGLIMSNINSNLTRLTATATFADLVNQSFPSMVYRPILFPGLAA